MAVSRSVSTKPARMGQCLIQQSAAHAAAAQRRIEDEPAQTGQALALILQRVGAQRAALRLNSAGEVSGL